MGDIIQRGRIEPTNKVNEDMTEKTLQVTVHFKDANPGNDNHLREILRNYLTGKGVGMNNESDVWIEI